MAQGNPIETLGPLFAAYEKVILQMPDEFTSHDFILRLAQQNQTAYVEALHAYRDRKRDGTPAPFMIVHGLLAQQLYERPELVQMLDRKSSKDIFGQTNECAVWRRLRPGAGPAA